MSINWDHNNKRILREALQSVYLSYSRLKIFVRDALDISLENEVQTAGLEIVTFELVEWSKSKGLIDRLYLAFCRENPHYSLTTRLNQFPDQRSNQPIAPHTLPTNTTNTPVININNQGGDYDEVNNQGTYAQGDIDNSVDNRREQKGMIVNDQANVTIHHQEIHYHPHANHSNSELPNSSAVAPVVKAVVKASDDRYVSHAAIEGVCQAALTNNGALLRIKAPHQMGKTSLAERLYAFAETQEYTPVLVDFQTIENSQVANLNQFWLWLCQKIADDCGVDVPLEKYWDQERLGSNSSCERYLQNAVLKSIPNALVLILENVDRLFDELVIAEEVFRLLRAFHEKAKTSKPWQKLRQVLTYSTEPLAKLDFANTHYSPFNVGKEIELLSLSAAQVQELAIQFGFSMQPEAIEQFMIDFGGHPALIQQVFHRLLENPQLDLGAIYHEVLHPTNAYLRMLDHQLTICNLQEVMAQIAQATEPIAINSKTAYALYRLGLVNWTADHQRVFPRCRLYRDRFRSGNS